MAGTAAAFVRPFSQSLRRPGPRQLQAMMSLRRAIAALLVLSPSFSPAALAQSTTAEAWPELDVYWRTSARLRSMLEVAMSTEREGDKSEATVGLYEDLLRLPAGYARLGFRYTFSTADASYRESRAVGEFVFRPWATETLRLLNRTRGELRWVNSDYSYRVRDRLHLQRVPQDSSGRAWAPYGTFEVYYDSRFDTIAKFGARVGTEMRIVGPASIDIYLARQNETQPLRRYVNAFGLTTKLSY
jgi:hypothetical protein